MAILSSKEKEKKGMHGHTIWEFLFHNFSLPDKLRIYISCAGQIYHWGKWRKWILACNVTMRFSSLVFGSHTGFYTSLGGVEQGDSLLLYFISGSVSTQLMHPLGIEPMISPSTHYLQGKDMSLGPRTINLGFKTWTR